MKRILTLILCALLLLACCACGQESVGTFRTLETIGTKHYSVICRKGDQLSPVINAAVDYLAASGNLGAVSSQWLGKDITTLRGDGKAFEALSPEEKQLGRTLIVGVEADARPMSFADGGEYAGVSVDIGRYLGVLLNCPVVFQPISAPDVGAQLASGNIDCAVGFDTSLVSAEKFDVGVSYMDSDIILAVRSESEVKHLRDIKGQRIGILDDPPVQAAIKSDEKVTKYASGATVYLSAERCFSALDSGWCAAVAMDRLLLAFAPQD